MTQRARRQALVSVIAAALGLVAAGLVPASALAAEHTLRVGAAPRTPSGSRSLGALASGAPLQLVVALRPRNAAALAAYASAVSTPGSPDDHDYLTPAEFRQLFGPAATEVASVDTALRSEGLDPGPISANGLLIPVDATAGAVARGLGVGFARYRLASGRVVYANTAAPRLSAAIGSLVTSVVGLNDIDLPHTVGLAEQKHPRRLAAALEPHIVTGGPQPCSTASSAASSRGAYTADQLASAYNFSTLYGAGALGAGQTVALVELSDNPNAYISTYQSCYGTTTTVHDVAVDGGALFSTTIDGEIEATLDIEDVIGLSPDATIDVYQAPNSSTGILEDYGSIVDNPSVTVVSTSWGECESAAGAPAIAAEATLFEQAAAEGKSVFAAAGDDGSEDCSASGSEDPALAVDDPGSQPYVTSVGGLTLSSTTYPPTESVWNDSGIDNGAGGGGISTMTTMPAYQATAPASLHVVNPDSSGAPCGAPAGEYCREVPDVSADGDPQTGYLVYFDGSVYSAPPYDGWVGIAGTSAAAPLWAAFAALTNSSSFCTTSPIGFANPGLYAAAANAYTSDFTDVTTGGNDYTPSGNFAGLYPAGVGYDMASGLGSPNGATLPEALCNTAAGRPTLTVRTPGAQGGTIGTPVALQIAATDSAGEPVAFSAVGLPAGLSISSGGAVTGTPSAAATSTVTVTATDGSDAVGQTTFTWTIAAPAPATTTTSTTTTTAPPPAAPIATPTPTTTTPAATPPVAVCTGGQLLANPGFESGGRDWSASPHVIVDRKQADGRERAHSGTSFAWLGGHASQHAPTLSQTVTIPSACDKVTLTFWRHIDTTRRRSSQAVDRLTVALISHTGGATKTLATYSSRNAAGGYQRASVTIDVQPGVPVTLRFAATAGKRGGGTTDFCIDDPALTVR